MRRPPTAVYFKERRRPNLTRVYYYRAGSAASRLTPDDLDSAYIGQAAYVHLTGITPALSATCRETVWEMLRIADAEDVRVSLDPNIRRRLWSEEAAREVLREMLAHTHLVLAGKEEAELLSGKTTPEEAAHAIREMGPTQVVVRLGAEGALAVGASGDIVHKPALPVHVVEPVGAGDAFNAGFLSGQLRDWSLGESLRLGNILGGLATTAAGDVEAQPTWDEVQFYLEGKTTITR